MNAPLPALLEANPRARPLGRLPRAGQGHACSTGRVEIGQGVLTAMAQIAADELDVSLERIAICSGDTELTPNEGYTAGSQSIQFGGVALRLACAEVRALFLDAGGAKCSAAARPSLSIARRRILRNGAPTGQDYWTLAGAVDLARQSDRRRRAQADRRSTRVVGASSAARRPAGKSVRRAGLHSRHAARRHGACARRAPAAAAAPRSARSTRPRSAAPPKGRSSSSATAISSPSSATTKPWSKPPPRPRRRT